MPLHHFSFVTIFTAVAVCAGCDDGTKSTPMATTQAAPRAVDAWRHDEMRLAAWGYEEVNGERIPNGDLSVLRWRVMEDDRPLVVEQAIVLIKTDDGRWRLASLYRHPKLPNPPVKWRLSSRVDVPFVNHRDFKTEPTPAEIDLFLKDAEWLPLPPRFRQTAGGGE